MSPFELKQLRHGIGATLSRMADLLGLSGANATDTVRKMEAGTKPITGPTGRLLTYMQQGVGEGYLSPVLPKFLTCEDLAGESKTEWVMHTRYPRFLATVTNVPVDGMDCVTADPSQAEWLCVAMWIDEPVGDTDAVLDRMANHFEKYTQDSLENLSAKDVMPD